MKGSFCLKPTIKQKVSEELKWSDHTEAEFMPRVFQSFVEAQTQGAACHARATVLPPAPALVARHKAEHR